jgi:hypothetical protein
MEPWSHHQPEDESHGWDEIRDQTTNRPPWEVSLVKNDIVREQNPVLRRTPQPVALARQSIGSLLAKAQKYTLNRVCLILPPLSSVHQSPSLAPKNPDFAHIRNNFVPTLIGRKTTRIPCTRKSIENEHSIMQTLNPEAQRGPGGV